MPTPVEQHQDTLELELEAALAKLRGQIAQARVENDWHTHAFLGHRADGIREAMEIVRRVYHEHLNALRVAS
jgi:hypothetical protein